MTLLAERLEILEIISRMRSLALGLSTTMRSTSSVRKSRTVRSMRSGSWKTQVAVGWLLDAFLDLIPLLQQQGQVADEIAFFLAFADRAHDDPHAFGNGEFAQDFLQALAFLLVLDLARDAALVGVGQQHQVTAGQDDVGGDARALGADGPLGDLHDDFAARRIERGMSFCVIFGFSRRRWSRSTISTPLSKLLGTMSQ